MMYAIILINLPAKLSNRQTYTIIVEATHLLLLIIIAPIKLFAAEVGGNLAPLLGVPLYHGIVIGVGGKPGIGAPQ